MPRNTHFSIRISDEAVQAADFLENETGISRSKIIDILLCRANVSDFDEHLHHAKENRGRGRKTWTT